ncbi:hypothetical protein EK0264_14180 [Epidermidibacterium keratini]|uniref:DUF2029 domain-containing protein n=1 Tax=Epidermidibacterium keratini TaxID=1891644 RepID=A0A7L4YQ73_9ACTN|nr:polyprenol phosphomannose-dependent alpha 1,6 mannosyltransferase MptB [Epidermidibacterium keratini]QHC01316.1 hypothetical protein EK0264_14180 [Epidermidibacterium keratini]
MGFLASLMVALGAACRTERVPNSAYYGWLERLGLGAIATDEMGRVLVTLGCALGVAVWLVSNPLRFRGRLPGWVLAAWCAPLALTLPVLSTDAYAYLDLGWQGAAGHDPYVAGLGTLGGPFSDYIVNWRGTQSPYPPLSLLIMEQAVRLGGFVTYPSLLLLRVPAIAGLAVLWWVVPRLAARVGASARWARWLVPLNPLVIVHGIGGLHLDILAAAIAMLALYVAVTRRAFVQAAALVGVAMLIKQTAAVALVPIALYAVADAGQQRVTLRHWRRAVAVGAAAVTVFGAVSLLSYGFGWVGPLSHSSMGSSMAPSNVAWSVVRMAFEIDHVTPGLAIVRRILTTGVLLVAIGVVIARFADSALRRPLVISGWLAFASVVAAPALREWYWIFPLAMLALVRDVRAYAACVGVTAYAMLSLPFAEYGIGAVPTGEKVLVATAIGIVLTVVMLATLGRWAFQSARVRAASVTPTA